MPYLNRDGGPRLHYLLDDSTDPWADAPYLVLQHGLLKSARFGYAWVPYLSRHYKVVRPDLRGHGLSGMDSEAPVDGKTLVGDVVDLLDHLGAERVHFCGEALGGIVGTLVAADAPNRVRSLSLISAPTKLSEATRTTFALGYADWPTALRTLGAKKWAMKLNAVRFSSTTDPDLLEWQAGEMGKQDVEAIITFTKLASGIDTVEALPRIQAPVLGMYGVGNSISGAAVDILRKNVRDIRIIELPTSQHAIFNSMPATCAKQVLAFCASIDGKVFHEL